jgi:hypothetical protein
VDQVALPYRIALVALLIVGALWFVALRPKGASSDGAQPTATAPGTTGLANDVTKAQGAVSASQASAARTEAAAGQASEATGSTSTSTSTSTSGAAPRAATGGSDLLAGVGTADPSRPLLRAVSRGRVAVLLFWNSKGSDDRAVRRAVLHLDRRHGKVLTRVIPLSRVGRYEAITRGVDVQGSPTVLVLNATGKVRSIVGYTTGAEIGQLVSDMGAGR